MDIYVSSTLILYTISKLWHITRLSISKHR